MAAAELRDRLTRELGPVDDATWSHLEAAGYVEDADVAAEDGWRALVGEARRIRRSGLPVSRWALERLWRARAEPLGLSADPTLVRRAWKDRGLRQDESVPAQQLPALLDELEGTARSLRPAWRVTTIDGDPAIVFDRYAAARQTAITPHQERLLRSRAADARRTAIGADLADRPASVGTLARRWGISRSTMADLLAGEPTCRNPAESRHLPDEGDR
jgi:hypothetical protein